MSIGAIFFLSRHTRVEGWRTVTDGTYSLFRDEYKLPLIPVEIAWIANVDRGVRTWIAGSGFLNICLITRPDPNDCSIRSYEVIRPTLLASIRRLPSKLLPTLAASKDAATA